MLSIAALGQIQETLLRVPQLVQEFEKQDAAFHESVKVWLGDLERLLSENQQSIAAEVATLRGALIAVSRLGVVPPGTEFRDRPTRSKIRNASAMHALQDAQALLTSEFRTPITQIAEADRMARMLLASAVQKGLLPLKRGRRRRPPEALEIWEAFSVDEELRQGLVHLTGLVGDANAAVIVVGVLPTVTGSPPDVAS